MRVESDRSFERPLVVAAFEGWNDGADAASDAAEHLLVAWKASPIASIDPEDYYDFQVTRPTVGANADGNREIHWRTTTLWWCSDAPLDRDVIVVTGIEPNLRWRSFCDDILDYLQDVGAEDVVTLGALLADVPHTRPMPVSGTASDPTVAKRLGLEPSRYSGPTGIVGVLTSEAASRGLTAASIWVAVPHYVAQPPCPKATMALLGHIEKLYDVSIDMGTLPDESAAWMRGVSDLAASDSDVADYIASLEEERDAAELPEASGDAIAAEFERYLRRRDNS
jgi:proteasome assembly chaperone (PAC2) family protein